MKDPNRIDRIIEALRTSWKAHPDQRLCQLIENVCRHSLHYQGHDLFYLEDDTLEKGLKSYPRVFREE